MRSRADIADLDRHVRYGLRVQPIDATPSNLARREVGEWSGMHGHGSRQGKGPSSGSAGRAVSVWRISLDRLGGGTRAASIGSWRSMEESLRRHARELR